MSKSKTAVATPAEAVTTAKGQPITKATLDQVAEAMKSYWKQNREKVALIALCFVAAAFSIAAATGSASFAILYLFAFNGKVSGRMDGNVLMRNGRGRGFAVPALIRNGYTMTARGIFSVLSSAYRGLGSLTIDAWRAFTMDATNRFGQPIEVKGKDAYVRLNANLINIGQATITSPPVLAGVDSITDVSGLAMDASADTLTFSFSVSPTATGVSHKLFATRPLSAGITRPSASEFRQVDVVPSGSTTPYDFSTAYINRFGSINGQAGNKIFIQLFGVNETTGQMTPSVGASGVIVP